MFMLCILRQFEHGEPPQNWSFRFCAIKHILLNRTPLILKMILCNKTLLYRTDLCNKTMHPKKTQVLLKGKFPIIQFNTFNRWDERVITMEVDEMLRINRIWEPEIFWGAGTTVAAQWTQSSTSILWPILAVRFFNVGSVLCIYTVG